MSDKHPVSALCLMILDGSVHIRCQTLQNIHQHLQAGADTMVSSTRHLSLDQSNNGLTHSQHLLSQAMMPGHDGCL